MFFWSKGHFFYNAHMCRQGLKGKILFMGTWGRARQFNVEKGKRQKWREETLCAVTSVRISRPHRSKMAWCEQKNRKSAQLDKQLGYIQENLDRVSTLRAQTLPPKNHKWVSLWKRADNRMSCIFQTFSGSGVNEKLEAETQQKAFKA